jgi:hypothetical protein
MSLYADDERKRRNARAAELNERAKFAEEAKRLRRNTKSEKRNDGQAAQLEH